MWSSAAPDGGFTVADVGSLNGTYVNRERIDAAALTNGDEVQIGKYRLVFYAEPAGHLTPRTPSGGGRVGPCCERRGGAGTAPPPRTAALMSIGAVLSQLRDEFPEVTISKIRFLEAEGLVEPQRTPSGLPQVQPPRTSSGCATSCGCSGTTTCRCG